MYPIHHLLLPSYRSLRIMSGDDLMTNELRTRLASKISSSGSKVLALWAMGLAEHVASSVEDTDSVGEAVSLCSEGVDGYIEGSMDHGEVRRRVARIRSLSRRAEGAERLALGAIGKALAVCDSREDAMTASDYAVEVVRMLYPGDGDRVSEEYRWQIGYFNSI